MRKLFFFLCACALIALLAYVFTEKWGGTGVSSGENESGTQTETSDAIVFGVQLSEKEFVIGQAILTRSGFIVVRKVNHGIPGEILGTSDYLAADLYNDVHLVLTTPAEKGDTLQFILYADNGNKKFSEDADAPILDATGSAIFSQITAE